MAVNTPSEIPVESQNQNDSRTDQQLIAAINAGDVAAFEVLYFRYRDWVVGLVYRLTGNEDLALDVLQETFLYFLRKFPGFRLTANLKTFLYPAVKNLTIAARRKAARYQSDVAEQERLEQIPAADRPAGAGSDLAVALANLSEEQREILLLRYSDGLTLAEIAEAAGVPLGTVKSRLHSALEMLRQDKLARQYFEK